MSAKRFWISFALLAAVSFFSATAPRTWQDSLKGCILTCTGPAQSIAADLRAGLLTITGSLACAFCPNATDDKLEDARREISLLRELLVVERSKCIEKEKMIAGLTAFEHFTTERYGKKLGVVPARIIGRDATGAPGVLVIDKGTADGVCDGAGVVWGYSAVGVVAVARKRSSLVNLFSNPACTVPAYIQRTGESTMVSGAMGATLAMHHVFREKVKQGDICLTSGELGIFPRDILIGEVTEATLPAGALFQSVSVRPQVDLPSLQTVVVLMREKREL